MTPPAKNAPVRAFISYAWEDDEYRQWVAQLAAQLREDGVDARLDRWHVQAGQTIPEFMSSEVRQADKVLVLCSPKYQEKVHAMEDGGPSTGSGWESMVLSSAMFTQEDRSKAVTALARGKWKESAPDYLQALPYDDLTQSDETNLRRAYTSLLQRLTGMTEGAPPVKLPDDIQAPDSVLPLFNGPSLDALATDRSALPPIVKLPTPHRMPYRSLGGRFAGRVDALWKLHDLLNQDDTAVVEGVGVVMGTGGLGKTQLATEYVHRFGNYYPGGVFWTDADQGLATVIQQIATAGRIDIDGAMPLHKQCEALWQTLAQTPAAVLMVFDNFSETEALQPWLPVGANLKALVTTRRRDLTYPKVSLLFLTHEEALDLLNNGERQFGSEATPLIDALGGLPLALELSRNFLNRRPTLNVDALLVEIADLGELAALNVFADHYKNELPTGHEKAVGATFQLSWDLASDAEQTLLRLMACWAPSSVPRRLLKRAAGDTTDSVLTNPVDNGISALERLQKLLRLVAFWAPSPVPKRLSKRAGTDTTDSVLTNPVDNGISALERLSLVELDEDYDPHLHRLLRGFVRSQTREDDEETKRQAVDSVKTELARTRTDADTAALTELEKVLPHGQAMLDTDMAEPKHAIDIAVYMCHHQQERGRYQLAKGAGGQALALAKQTYASGHTEIARCQSYLGAVLLEIGDLKGAKTLFTQTLESNQQSYEPGHPEIARNQSNLGLVLMKLGDLEGTKTLITEALASDQQCYEPGHPSIANRQSSLAMVLLELGDFEGAKALLIQSYEAFKNGLGEDHPNTLKVKGHLEVIESEIQKC